MEAYDYYAVQQGIRAPEQSIIDILTGAADDADYRRVFRVITVRDAMCNLLTPRQYDYLAMSIDGISQQGIARLYGVDCSTVSRTISRAKYRLALYLRYGLLPRMEPDIQRAYMTARAEVDKRAAPV